jgi:hypothetical protein
MIFEKKNKTVEMCLSKLDARLNDTLSLYCTESMADLGF